MTSLVSHQAIRVLVVFMMGLMLVGIGSSAVFARKNSKAFFNSPPPGIFYTVTGTIDNADAIVHGGSGTASDPFQMSSLRGAVLNANTQDTAALGQITISVPAGNYMLSVNNPNTPATTGTISFPDLQVGSTSNRDTVIVGVGGMPKVQQTVAGNDVITTGFQADGFTPVAVSLTLQNLEITGGQFSGIFTGVDNTSGRSNTTISGCNVHNNSNPFGQGGGIFNQTGNLTITNSTFSSNTASFQGGAVFFDLPNSNGSPGTFGNFVVTNSTFSNNTASANNNIAGGAIAFFGPNRSENTYSITGSTFTNNHATGTSTKGGGIGTGGAGTLLVNLSRFKDNTATGTGTGVASQGSSPIDATNNWWGCDDFPGASGCDTSAGLNVTTSPRLDLVFIATPACDGTVLTADFTKNSANSTVSPSVLNGLTVTFAVVSGPGGANVTPASVAIANSIASSTLNGPTGGPAIVSASLDNGVQNATTDINKSVTITQNPTDQAVCDSGLATFVATADGSPSPTVKWQVSTDGGSTFNDIPGATSPTLTFTATSGQNGNKYRAMFTNSCGSATTTAAILTFKQNTATTKPNDQLVCEGSTATFTTTASGTGPFSFVWKKGATVLNNGGLGGRVSIVNTATTSTLSISNGQAGDSGGYSVETTGACSSAIQTANLTVNSSAPVITLNGQTISLWPPNHKYETINVTDLVASASAACDPSVNINSVVIAQVTSDEPDDNPSGADGSTINDIVIAPDCKSVQLRAERDGNLNGRVYTITFRVRDTFGHVTTATAKVTVPKSQNGSAAVDDGPHNTVNSSCP